MTETLLGRSLYKLLLGLLRRPTLFALVTHEAEGRLGPRALLGLSISAVCSYGCRKVAAVTEAASVEIQDSAG